MTFHQREVPMPIERVDFANSRGQTLAALLELPDREPVATALFAHCFTCGKDNLAAKRIAETLAQRGIAVLRFDFTGLGMSEGEFANTDFSSNVAVLAAAARVPEARAVATIAAPSDPGHVTGLFKDKVEEIRARGEVEVALAGRPFRIRREFLDDVAEQKTIEAVVGLRKALLVLHSPTDDTVGIDNASRIFLAARHPKSFVSLVDADHLLTRRGDAIYAADVIAAWAGRYLEAAPRPDAAADAGPRPVVVTETGAS